MITTQPGHNVSITMEAAFSVEALEEALAKHGKPEIFDTDQGSQFTGTAFHRPAEHISHWRLLNFFDLICQD
jgi:transposase InsO family protein